MLYRKKGLVLSQRKYALELISDVGLGGKVVRIPMELNLNLTSRKYDEHLKLNEDDKPIRDVNLYRRLIGILLYLTITQTYISFVVHNLNQYM